MTVSADPEEHTMTLWEHLDELRSRIVRMAFAFAAGAGIAWYYRERVLEWLTVPYITACNQLHIKPVLSFISPAAAFICYVRIAAMAGFVGALPFILYQLWAFIAPGLYSREKKFAVPFVLSSCFLFGLGGWFGWRFAFQLAFVFLLKFAGPVGALDVNAMWTIGDYIDFVSHMLLAFGVASELPILVFFLTVAGLVTHRELIKFFRYFVVIAFAISAVLTPPDPLSQLLLAVPLCGLYGISILIAFLFSRHKQKAASE